LEHTGQHFAGGEQATAMPPNMLDGGVATARVQVTSGVLDQVNRVAALDEAKLAAEANGIGFGVL
jgi:hypothetical protein